MLDKKKMLQVIRRNIQQSGFHLYIVGASELPRVVYTIGLRDILGAELLMPGCIHFDADEVVRIMHSIVRQLTGNPEFDGAFTVASSGLFSLRKADPTWTRPLMLGALDYYGSSDFDAYQVTPDQRHWTVDIPDTARPWSAAREPAWRSLHEAWPYDVPARSTATTNLAALQGACITEVARWGEGEWEMFA